MAKQSLRNILGKKNDVFVLVTLFIEQLDADVSVEDENGKLLLGNAGITPAFKEEDRKSVV